MERKYITCDSELCTGCGICELICSATKHGVFQPELSRIRTVRIDRMKAISIACRFCEDTPCITACPREALWMDEENNVIRLEKVRCTGCGWCIEACDFGAISMDHSTKSVVICDLCEGLDQPKCVAICPKDALKISTLEIKAQSARGKAAESLT